MCINPHRNSWVSTAFADVYVRYIWQENQPRDLEELSKADMQRKAEDLVDLKSTEGKGVRLEH